MAFAYHRLSALALCGWIALVQPAGVAQAQVVFTEVAERSGLWPHDFDSVSGHAFGICWSDIDADGWPDIVVSNGSDGHVAIFLNQQDGTFLHAGYLLPTMTQQERPGVRAADVDNDGDQDLLIQVDAPTISIPGANSPVAPPNVFLRNQLMENGGIASVPLFVDESSASGLDSTGRDYGAAFLDYDLDGWLDVYLGRFVHSSPGEPGNQDAMFRNDGTGNFVDATVASGIDLSATPAQRSATIAVIGAHLDEDALPDIYAVGNMYLDRDVRDPLFLNNGDGTLRHATGDSPGFGDDSQSPMGVDTADINHDGYWDLYVSDIYMTTWDEPPLGNPLNLGTGGGHFGDNVAVEFGVTPAVTAWGVNFFDMDHDQWDDLYVASSGTDHLYVNQRGTAFAGQVLSSRYNTRGSAVADYDRDGDLDLALAVHRGGILLYRNDTLSGNWLELTLRGVSSNRDAIGVLVHATLGDTTLMRQIKGGTSLHSQDENLIHFGLGDAIEIDALTVSWPSGLVETRTNVAANQRLRLEEGGWSDPDGDGVSGEADNCPWTPNAGLLDGDGDGLGDDCDDCPAIAGSDEDGDGLCPDVDPCPRDPHDDADADGACGDVDNCPTVANGAQTDTDGDGLGDACDPCPNDPLNDWERDGLCADEDVCPNHTSNLDEDADGVCDAEDNCPLVANADQEDGDGDDLGDACDVCPGDTDRDGDGACDADDNCLRVANADQANADGDALGDICDPCPDAADNLCLVAGDGDASGGDGDGDASTTPEDTDDGDAADEGAPNSTGGDAGAASARDGAATPRRDSAEPTTDAGADRDDSDDEGGSSSCSVTLVRGRDRRSHWPLPICSLLLTALGYRRRSHRV